MDVCPAYVFARLRFGQDMALYRGAVKIHKVNREVTKNVIESHHMTREAFVILDNTVFDLHLPKAAYTGRKAAEKTRDSVMHGKSSSDNEIRNVIAGVLEYSGKINVQLNR